MTPCNKPVADRVPDASAAWRGHLVPAGAAPF